MVLDASRYDVFKEVNWLSGKLEKAISAGSTTAEWALNTFTDYYPNVVYVSSVPYISAKIATQEQKKFIGLQHFSLINDVWDWGYDDECGTVVPEVVADAALQAKKEYPGRNIIAHFMQPHCPYIGSPPLTLKIWGEMIGQVPEAFPPIKVFFDQGYGELLKDAYKGNLVRVLKVVQEMLLPNFKHVAITADHGEGFGEGGVYGHGEGIREPALIEVPWFTT